jgi:Mg2+ and Co2+ transporter CorA
MATVLGGILVPDYFQQILEIRRVLTPVIRAIGPYRSDLVGTFAEVYRLPGMDLRAQQYFEAHRNHVVTVFEDAGDCRDETRDALQAYSSAAAEQQGRVINLLTVVAAIFLPLTFITGYFGMNFPAISHLHGWLPFTLLGGLLPVLLATASGVVLRRIIRRMGVRLLPSQRPTADAPGGATRDLV